MLEELLNLDSELNHPKGLNGSWKENSIQLKETKKTFINLENVALKQVIKVPREYVEYIKLLLNNACDIIKTLNKEKEGLEKLLTLVRQERDKLNKNSSIYLLKRLYLKPFASPASGLIPDYSILYQAHGYVNNKKEAIKICENEGVVGSSLLFEMGLDRDINLPIMTWEEIRPTKSRYFP